MLAQLDSERPLEPRPLEPRPLEPRPLDLATLATEAVCAARMAQPGRSIILGAGDPVITCADAERLRQVIDDLISNAVRHTPRGSPVTVTSPEPKMSNGDYEVHYIGVNWPHHVFVSHNFTVVGAE